MRASTGAKAERSKMPSDPTESDRPAPEQRRRSGRDFVRCIRTRSAARSASGDESRAASKQSQRLNAIHCASQPLASFLHPCRIQISMCQGHPAEVRQPQPGSRQPGAVRMRPAACRGRTLPTDNRQHQQLRTIHRHRRRRRGRNRHYHSRDRRDSNHLTS